MKEKRTRDPAYLKMNRIGKSDAEGDLQTRSRRSHQPVFPPENSEDDETERRPTCQVERRYLGMIPTAVASGGKESTRALRFENGTCYAAGGADLVAGGFTDFKKTRIGHAFTDPLWSPDD